MTPRRLHHKEILLSKPGRNRRECILTRNSPFCPYWAHFLGYHNISFDSLIVLVSSSSKQVFVPKELPRVNRTYDPVEDQKVNFLVFQKFYLNFAVFLSKLIKTYILLNFIHYYKNSFRRNHTCYHYT